MGSFKLKTEHLFVLLIIILLAAGFMLRNFPFTDGNLSEDSPANRITFDAFFHVWYAKGVHDSGQVRMWPSYSVYGTETLFIQPPLLYTFVGSFAALTTMPVYRLFYVLIAFLGVWLCFQSYVIFRTYFSEKAALLGLAFALFPTWNWLMFYVMGFTMDFVAFIMVPFALFLCLKYLEEPKLWYAALFAILMAASFLAHPYQAAFSLLNFALFFFIMWIARKIPFRQIVTFGAVALPVFIIIILYYLPLFYIGYFSNALKLGSAIALGNINPPPDYFWPMTYHPLLIIGAIVLLIVLFLQWKGFFKDKEKIGVLVFLLAGISLLLLMYMGVEGNRIVRYHFMLAIMLSFLPAIGYAVLLNLIKQKTIRTILLLLFVAGAAYFFFAKAYPVLDNAEKSSLGLHNDDKWEALQYMRDNTPKNATFFSLTGYFHNFQRFSERVSFNGDLGRPYTTDTYQTLCSGVMPEHFQGRFEDDNFYIGQAEGTAAVSREGFFSFTTFTFPKKYLNNTAGIEDFDYLVYQYANVPQIQPCIDFFSSQIALRGYDEVYRNPTMVIYKVNKNV